MNLNKFTEVIGVIQHVERSSLNLFRIEFQLKVIEIEIDVVLTIFNV